MASNKRKRKDASALDEANSTNDGKHSVARYSQCSASVQSRRRTQLYHAICEIAGVHAEADSEDAVRAECVQLLSETLKKTAPAKAILDGILDNRPLDSVIHNVKALHASLPIERRNGVLALVANVFTGTELQQRWGFEFGPHQLRTAKQMAATSAFSVDPYKRTLPPSRKPKSEQFIESVVQFILKNSAPANEGKEAAAEPSAADSQRTLARSLRSLYKEFVEQSPSNTISYSAFRTLVLSKFNLKEPSDPEAPAATAATASTANTSAHASLSLRPIKPLAPALPLPSTSAIATASATSPKASSRPALASKTRILTSFSPRADLTFGYGSQQFSLLTSPLAPPPPPPPPLPPSLQPSSNPLLAAAAFAGDARDQSQQLWHHHHHHHQQQLQSQSQPQPQPQPHNHDVNSSNTFIEPSGDNSQFMPAIPFNPFGVEPIQSLQSLNLPSLASLSQRDSDIMLQSSMQNLSQSLGYDASLTSPTVIFRSPPTSLMAIGAQTQAQGSTEPVPGPLPTNQAAEPMPDTADAYAMSSIHKYFEIPTPTIHNNNLNGDDQADTNAIAPEFFYF